MDKITVRFEDEDELHNARYSFSTYDGTTWIGAVEDYINFLDEYCGYVIDEKVKKKIIKSIYKHQNKRAMELLKL